MHILLGVVSIFLLSLKTVFASNNTCNNKLISNSCATFTISAGTGCAWMCNYCANQLQTNNYYFTDNVCTYQETVGCVGNPITGNSYTCCSV